MDEFNIVRQMNELADKIDALYEVQGRLKSSDKKDILTSFVVEKHESIAVRLKNYSLVTMIEAEIDILSNIYDELKTQLLNSKNDG